jgi:hypothetical protein
MSEKTIVLGYNGSDALWPLTLFESARSSLAVASALTPSALMHSELRSGRGFARRRAVCS